MIIKKNRIHIYQLLTKRVPDIQDPVEEQPVQQTPVQHAETQIDCDFPTVPFSGTFQ